VLTCSYIINLSRLELFREAKQCKSVNINCFPMTCRKCVRRSQRYCAEGRLFEKLPCGEAHTVATAHASRAAPPSTAPPVAPPRGGCGHILRQTSPHVRDLDNPRWSQPRVLINTPIKKKHPDPIVCFICLCPPPQPRRYERRFYCACLHPIAVGDTF